jgi:heat-inducible transcriptional repressor
LREANEGAEVFVGGASRLAAAFEAVDQVREVLGILEKQLVVVSLIDDVLERGMQVAIGEETGVDVLAECSIVVAPYHIEGQPAGTVGVLGPTRMDYSQALSAVAVVSRRLGTALSEG